MRTHHELCHQMRSLDMPYRRRGTKIAPIGNHAKTGEFIKKAVVAPSQSPKFQPTARAWGRRQLGYEHMHATIRWSPRLQPTQNSVRNNEKR